jgi:hypothetical protein
MRFDLPIDAKIAAIARSMKRRNERRLDQPGETIMGSAVVAPDRIMQAAPSSCIDEDRRVNAPTPLASLNMQIMTAGRLRLHRRCACLQATVERDPSHLSSLEISTRSPDSR